MTNNICDFIYPTPVFTNVTKSANQKCLHGKLRLQLKFRKCVNSNMHNVESKSENVKATLINLH